MKQLVFLIFMLVVILGCSIPKAALKKEKIELVDAKGYFEQCGVEGSIVIFDIKGNRWLVTDSVSVDVATLPASTFKIINLLIALETKVIKDENEVVQWKGVTDTVKYGYRPEIYRDMTVKEAFELSAGWVFIELAKKIGRENYQIYLNKCRYGNNDLSQKETDFWNFGAFAISPRNQVSFMRDLIEERLPFSKRNMAIVKKVMITTHNEEFVIRSKTGWTRENNVNVGWWTGYVESDEGIYVFATRLIQDRKFNRADFGSCRKEVTLNLLSDLKILPPNVKH